MKARQPKWQRGFAARLRKPILLPRVRDVRVATHFPEAEYVAVEKNNFANELRAFPRVALRNDDARRAAVFFRQRLIVPRVRDEDVIIHADGERVVRRVAIVALEENVRG